VSQRLKSPWLRWGLLSAGLALLAAIVVHIGVAEIGTLVVALGWNFLAIVVIFAVHECVRARALGLCIEPHQRPPFRQLLRVRLLGEAAGTLTRTGPFAAEPTRALILKGHTLRGAHAVGAAASELIANSTVSAVATVVIATYALRIYDMHPAINVLLQVLLWASAGYAAISLWALTTRTFLIGRIVGLVGRLPFIGGRVRAGHGKVRRMEEAIHRALTGRGSVVTRVLLLEIAAQAILIAEIFWTIRSMGVDVTGESSVLASVLIKAPNIIQFIGVTEGGYALIFGWLGMTAAVGLTLSLVRMLRSLVVSAVGLALL
jgi:hypothetical protein